MNKINDAVHALYELVLPLCITLLAIVALACTIISFMGNIAPLIFGILVCVFWAVFTWCERMCYEDWYLWSLPILILCACIMLGLYAGEHEFMLFEDKEHIIKIVYYVSLSLIVFLGSLQLLAYFVDDGSLKNTYKYLIIFVVLLVCSIVLFAAFTPEKIAKNIAYNKIVNDYEKATADDIIPTYQNLNFDSIRKNEDGTYSVTYRMTIGTKDSKETRRVTRIVGTSTEPQYFGEYVIALTLLYFVGLIISIFGDVKKAKEQKTT